MDLRTAYPFWLLRGGIIRSYASLEHDTRADIVVMGGGISGALTAWYLCKAGFDVIVVDKRHIGMGSTAASTALLQYEIDTPLTELSRRIGEKNAVLSYQLCIDAIARLREICGHWTETGFRLRPSLQYASFKKDIPWLREEYDLRRKNGIQLEWLDRQDIISKFGFAKDAALFSRTGAEVNAYDLCHALLHHGHRYGLRVHAHTPITGIRELKNGVELKTLQGQTLRARKLVIACGYEAARYIPRKVQTLQSTYAIVSEPVQSSHLWHRNALIWETARPYLYLRTTTDNRVLIGGKDDAFSDPHLRNRALPAKARALEHAFVRLFPAIRFKTDFSWAGVFASTKDGLPFIGSLPGKPHTYFALGFGGNGITFSVIAAQIISQLAAGKKVPHAGIFGFNRAIQRL